MRIYMKYLKKLKKNFVINTKYLPKKQFNEPIYLINSNNEYVEAYSVKNEKIIINKIKIENEYAEKTFITIKDFFRHCTPDDTEYKIEKVDNGDVYIRVAYFNDLSLFFRLRKNKGTFILTNINKYKFYPTNLDTLSTLNKINYISSFESLKLNDYLHNLKNIKRDYIFTLNNSKDTIEKQYNRQK